MLTSFILSIIPQNKVEHSVNPFEYLSDVNVNYIFKKKRNLMFRKNGIIFFRIFDESLEACDSQFAIL